MADITRLVVRLGSPPEDGHVAFSESLTGHPVSQAHEEWPAVKGEERRLLQMAAWDRGDEKVL